MKRFFIVCLLLLGITNYISAQSFTEWKDLEESSVNIMEPHSNVIPYLNDRNVENLEYKTSPYYQSLNGKWKRYMVKNLSDISKEYIEKKQFESVDPIETQVPNARQSAIPEGLSVLLNSEGNFSSSLIEKNNSASVYTFDFDVASDWKNHLIFLNFESVNAAFYLWINDKFVGYSENASMPSEFDITPYIKVGKQNTLTMLAYRLSDGTYLDFYENLYWEGILQDAYLYAKTKIHVSNFTVGTTLSRDYNDGMLALDIELKNYDKKNGYYVEIELLDTKGRQVDRFFQWIQMEKNGTEKISFNKQIAKIERWTAEMPNLYTLLIRIKDQKNQIIELTGSKIAFRNVEINQDKLFINGKNIQLKGVNYSQCFDQNGNTWSEEAMIKDMKTMKIHNINAVQIKSGPVSKRFYELCDEYGLYVVNTPNISLKQNAFLKNLDWEDAIIERIESLYERDKNHPCIIAWSLGESVGNGTVFNNIYKWLKQQDQTRLVLFEAAGTDGNTDMFFPKRFDLESLTGYATSKARKPLVISSIGELYGNGLGSFVEYWNLINKYSLLQGVFVDEFRRKGFPEELVNNKGLEKNLIEGGLVDFSGVVLPQMIEIKNIFKPFKVHVVNLEQGEFSIENLFEFNTFKDYRFGYIIFSNFKENGIIEGEIPIVAQPGERADIKIRIPEIYTYGGEEYLIRFYLQQKYDSPTIPKGTELGFEDYKIKTKVQERQQLQDYDYRKLEVAEENNQIQIGNGEFLLIFDKSVANIVSLKYNNSEIITQSPILSFQRPETFSEKFGINKKTEGDPRGILNNIHFQVKDLKCRQQNEYTYLIDIIYDIIDADQIKIMDLSQSYIILGNGDIILDNELLLHNKNLNITKLGWEMRLSKAFYQADWFGRDIESYIDRKEGAKLGVFRQSIGDLRTKYTFAQENGNRTDTRWVAFSDSVNGLFIDFVDSLFNFSISPYTNKDLESGVLSNQLKELDYWNVNIDYKKEGIGLGKPRTEIADKYRLIDEKYHFTMHLRPFSVETSKPENFRMNALPMIRNEVLPMPFITKNRERFDSTMTITLSSPIPDTKIYYTLDDSEPTEKSLLYTKPFNIGSSTIVKARLFAKDKTPSFTASKTFKLELISKVDFENQPNTPYNRNAGTVLIDRYQGNVDFKEDNWLGFARNDFIVNVELKKDIDLKQVSIVFGHDPESWVFLPENVTISVSSDGNTYSQPTAIEMPFNPILESENNKRIETATFDVNYNNVKYIKIQAKNIEKIPSWHKAKGLNAWILVSEIEVMEKTTK